MAQPTNPKNNDNGNLKIKHRTVTLNGVHNKNKALYRLGVTADEIHRAKALLTMGGTEDTYQNTLQYYSHNHHPSQSFVNKIKPTTNNNNNNIKINTIDPLENEYTHNSQTQDTIDQSFLTDKRQSNSYTNSITYTHNSNHNQFINEINKSNKSSKSLDEEKKSNVLMKSLSSDSESDSGFESEHSSENDNTLHNHKNRKYIRQNPHFNIKNNNNNNNNNNTPKDWFQFDQINNKNNNNNIINTNIIKTYKNNNDNMAFEFINQIENNNNNNNSNNKKINKYSHPTKHLSPDNTPRKHNKKNIKTFDLSNDFSDENTNKKRKKSSKSEKKLRKPSKTRDKKDERYLWNQNRLNKGYHDSTSDVINSSKKVMKFFGDDPNTNNKLNWKLGETVDQMMDMRSIDIINIVSRDDTIRKKEKKQFTRKAKLIRKLSSIKLRFGSNKNIPKNDNDIESKNFLSNSSFSDCDNDNTQKYDTGNESGASTQSTNTDIDDNGNGNGNGVPAVNNTMIIYPYHSGLQNGSNGGSGGGSSDFLGSKHGSNSQSASINGIRNGKNGGYHIDQSLFTFQNPNKNGKMNKQRASSYLPKSYKKSLGIYVSKSRSPSPGGGGKGKGKFYRKKNKGKVRSRYGFNANGRVNMKDMNSQIRGMRKLLDERKTLSEIISVYYSQYGFCVDFIVSLVSSIDKCAPEYIGVVSRHVDKQIKILHNLSLWQYILRVQMTHIDIKRFFYSFGPLIGKYKTLISPLHLTARKLIEIGGRTESHITLQTSTPECVYAFNIFKWLLFIGYDINDGDIDNTITPQTILNHAPRILKQILAYQRQFLFKQRQCMKVVDNTIYKQYKILLDDDILQVIEKFTYNKYRKSRAGFGHKKFVK